MKRNVRLNTGVSVPLWVVKCQNVLGMHVNATVNGYEFIETTEIILDVNISESAKIQQNPISIK